MNATEIAHANLPDEGAHRCMWQLTPQELPPHMKRMALEMWQDAEGFHVFVFYLHYSDGPWYDKVVDFSRFSEDVRPVQK